MHIKVKMKGLWAILFHIPMFLVIMLGHYIPPGY